MEKLLSDCDLECSEDKQLSILEKCMILILPDKDQKTKNLGYLLIEKVLEKCTQQCIQSTQTRLAKRLPDLADDPTIYGGLFLRRLLLRNPKIGDLHIGVIDRIIMNIIDKSIVEENDNLRKLSIELFSLRYGAANSTKLLKTVKILLIGSMISAEEKDDILDLKTVGLSDYRLPLITLLLDVFSSTLEYSKYDNISREDLLAVFEKGLKFDDTVLSATLRAIASLCKHTGSGVIPIISLLVSSLIGLLNTPSSQMFQTLNVIAQMYGPSSSLHRHFFILFSSVAQPLHTKEYGMSAAKLLASVIRSSYPLIKHEVLLSVQRNICEMAVRFPSSNVYHTLLRAFLSISHDLVPVPIQVARSVIFHSADQCDEIKDLCELISRPRIQNLSMPCMSRKTATSSHKSAELNEDTNDAENFSNQVTAVLNDIAAHQNGDGKVEGPIVIIEEQIQRIEVIEEEVTPMIIEEEKAPNALTAKRSAVAENSTPTPVKKLKKTKKSTNPVPTILNDGEASVDDIMGMFCPN